MILGIVQGGPGASNQHQSTVLYGGALGPVLLRIKNVGSGVVLVSTDQIQLQNGAAGEPIDPGEKWEQQYPANVRLFALSPNPGGGLVSVEPIPVPAPAASVPLTMWEHFVGFLSTPISRLCLALMLFTVPVQAQTVQTPIHASLGLNVIQNSNLTVIPAALVYDVDIPAGATAEYFYLYNPNTSSQGFTVSIYELQYASGSNNPGEQVNIVQTHQIQLGCRNLAINDTQGNSNPNISSVGFGSWFFLCPFVPKMRIYVYPSNNFELVMFVATGSVPLTAGPPWGVQPSTPPGFLFADNSVVCSGDTVLNGRVSIGNFVACTPVDLNVNVLTLPGSGTTALSNIIDTRGVKQATLLGTCTQAVTVNAAEYEEDGATPQFTVSLTSAASTSVVMHFASEQAVQSNTAPTSQVLQFPQRALAFSFTNGGAMAGTCTARLFLAY